MQPKNKTTIIVQWSRKLNIDGEDFSIEEAVCRPKGGLIDSFENPKRRGFFFNLKSVTNMFHELVCRAQSLS